LSTTINTNIAPPPAAQTLVKPTGIQPEKTDQTPAAAAQGPRDPTPAPQAKPVPLATSGTLGTRVNTSA